MSTVISPEITEKSPWWISRQRYYELKHFCLQYPEWKKQIRYLDGLQSQAPYSQIPKTATNDISDPVAKVAILRSGLTRKIDIVEEAARQAGEDLSVYILESITEGLSYSVLLAKRRIPCNKNEYYDIYRKFFWILDKLRD